MLPAPGFLTRRAGSELRIKNAAVILRYAQDDKLFTQDDNHRQKDAPKFFCTLFITEDDNVMGLNTGAHCDLLLLLVPH